MAFSEEINKQMVKEAVSATPNYAIDYNNERFTKVEAEKQQALDEIEQTYSGMIDGTDKFYQDQIQASKDWADKQTQLQQEQTDFAIEQINQQKDQAQKDYLKEQSASYVDWQKQSNKYGANAEAMASAGLTNTGFSESSQVSMYNTYQNRVATAREAFSRAVLNYDNAIKDAQLQNNALLAEIAYQALQKQLELSLEGFQYKNQLIAEQTNKKLEVDNTYWQRYQDVLNQVNTENALKEEVRQFELNYNENVRQFNQSYELQVKEFNEQIRQFNEEIARLKKKDEQEYQLQIKELELKKQEAEEAKRQWEEEMKLKREQLEEEKRQFDKLHPTKTYSSPSSGDDDLYINKTKESGTIQKAVSALADATAKSVAALGRGPLTANALAKLVNSGQVSYSVNNGQVSFSNTNNKTAAAQSALDKYTWLK